MMQGGDPTGTGAGGSGVTIKGEFAANGVKNKLSHTRGAISMARSPGVLNLSNNMANILSFSKENKQID